MNEFVNKLIGRLEELKKLEMDREENITEDGYWEDCEEAFEDGESNGMYTAYTKAIQIVNQLAEEYNDGWIPCSERLPEEPLIYEVKARFNNQIIYTEFAYYDASRCEWWKHDDDGLVNAIAWREHTPYSEKETSKDCNNCTNNTELDEVDNGCYMCCKGFEDNFQPKGE